MSSPLLMQWRRVVARRGGHRALRHAADGREVTFHELDRLAEAWRAAHLPDARAAAGRLVVFAQPNGIDWFTTFLGLLKAGAVAVPLDSAEPSSAQQATADALRAAGWWDGSRWSALPHARRCLLPDACLVKLTSGTTGQPKPLLFTARQMMADGRQVTATMGITARDTNYALIPFGHSYGLGNLTFPLLTAGVPIVVGSSSLPRAIAADFAQEHPTVFPSVPALWRALAESDLTLPGLRLGISAGAPLPAETARAFFARFGLRLHNFYGSSETGGIAYDRTGQATLHGSVGTALRGVRLTLGSGGVLRVSSAAVLTHGHRRRGAAGRSSRTSKKRPAHGLWIMADIVEQSPQGALFLRGRRGQTVKIAGRRLDLGEVLARVRALPGVTDAWIGVRETAEPQLGAVVVTRRPTHELRAALLAQTAAWKVPKKWLALPALPTNARGKLDRPRLQSALFPPPTATRNVT